MNNKLYSNNIISTLKLKPWANMADEIKYAVHMDIHRYLAYPVVNNIWSQVGFHIKSKIVSIYKNE